MKLGIRQKIALATIILIVISVLSVGIFAYSNTANALETLRVEEFQKLLEELKEIIDLNIKASQSLVKFIAVTPAIQAFAADGETGNAAQLLADGIRIYDKIETLLLTNAQGIVVASSDSGNSVGVNLSDRGYFRTNQSGADAISEVITSRITGNTAFVVSTPLHNSQGEFRGALVAVLGFDEVIGNYVQKLRVGQTGYSWMVDRDGLVLSHPNKDHILQTNLAKNENPELAAIVRKMGQGEQGNGKYTFEGEKRLTVYMPVANWALAFAMDVKEYMAPAYEIRNSIIVVGIIFAIVGIVVSYLIANQIGNPVVKMMEAMKRAENGDLTVQVQVRTKDEIGRLGHSFNAMLQGQKNIIGKVLESAASVSAAAQELSAAVEESNAAMQEISSTVESEVAASAQNIALASDKAAENGRSTRSVAEKGAAAVEEAGRAIKQIHTSSREVSGVIAELDEASRQINMIIKTITDIAEQTNLLALNAAIEAARAGEQGRGFAVVAEEVRKLAEGSSQAAGEISKLIMNIQVKTENAVAKMAGASQVVDKGTELAANAQSDLEQIKKAVGHVGELIDQIAAAAQEQSASAEQISASTQEQTGVLEEVAATTGELANMAENLNALVSHFKI